MIGDVLIERKDPSGRQDGEVAEDEGRRADPRGALRAGTSHATVVLGGVRVDALTEQQAIDHIVRLACVGVGGLVVTPNVDHLRQLSRGGGLVEAYGRATLTLADGQPLVWASRLQGQPLPERVAGSSLLWSLAAAAADNGLDVALIGGTEGSAGATASQLLSRSPTLRVTLVATPQVSPMPSVDEVAGLAAQIEESRPAIAFLAFGAPKQELLGAALRARFPGVWFLGVGASFEMASGSLPRAPLLLQRAGLEWLWRLANEPRRLARRYLLEDLPFVPHLFGQSLRERIRRRSARGRAADDPT